MRPVHFLLTTDYCLMRHLIIGASAAGLTAAATLRAYDPGSAGEAEPPAGLRRAGRSTHG